MNAREQAEYWEKKAELEEREAKLQKQLDKIKAEQKEQKLDVNPMNVFGRQSTRIFDFINFAQAKAKAFEWIMIMLFWLHVFFTGFAIVNMYLGSNQAFIWIALLLIPFTDYWIYKNFLKIDLFKKVDENEGVNKKK